MSQQGQGGCLQAGVGRVWTGGLGAAVSADTFCTQWGSHQLLTGNPPMPPLAVPVSGHTGVAVFLLPQKTPLGIPHWAGWAPAQPWVVPPRCQVVPAGQR